MKILVAATALNPDKTSEGICGAKFVLALMHAGHEVLVLTSDSTFHTAMDWVEIPWLGRVRTRHLDAYPPRNRWSRYCQVARSIATSGGVGRYVNQKVDAAIAYATGYPAEAWNQTRQWTDAFDTVIAAERPDLVFVRSAGGEFRPHLGMLNCRHSTPWVGNYHDPFPVSLYPEPYRSTTPFLSRRQERLHHLILDGATAVTFPSERLRHWVLEGRPTQDFDKAFVLPHVGMALPPLASSATPAHALELQAGHFNLVHAGTLLGPRAPWTLVSAFDDFLAGDPDKMRHARLVLVGAVNRHHLKSSKWQELIRHPNVVVHSERVSYAQSLDLVRDSTAAIVLEAPSTQSPFFPAKLADYLWLEKPILGFSPASSVVADMLGSTYPLLAEPQDTTGIVRAFETLWTDWKRGNVSSLLPNEHARRHVSEASLLHEFDRLLGSASLQSQWPATRHAPAIDVARKVSAHPALRT